MHYRAIPYLIRVVGAGHKEEKPSEGVLGRAGKLSDLGPYPTKATINYKKKTWQELMKCVLNTVYTVTC